MLSSGFLLHVKNTKENYNDGNTGSVRAIVIIFVLLVILDIALLIYSLSCLFELNVEWYVKMILIIFMLTPTVGFFTMIGIIIYYHTQKSKKPVNIPVNIPVANFHFF